MGADTCCFVCDISMTTPAVKLVNWKKYHNRFFFCRVLVFSDWVIDWNLHVSRLIGALIIVSRVKLIHNAAEELQFSIEARKDHNNEGFLSCFSAPVSLNYKGLLRIEMIQEKNNKVCLLTDKITCFACDVYRWGWLLTLFIKTVWYGEETTAWKTKTIRGSRLIRIRYFELPVSLKYLQ